MSLIHRCDKCKKIISNLVVPWDSSTTYYLNQNGKELKVRNQKIRVEVKIILECGEKLELCRKCGFEVIKKYLRRAL